MKNIKYYSNGLYVDNIMEKYYMLMYNKIKNGDTQFKIFLINDFHILKLTEYSDSGFSILIYRVEHFNHIIMNSRFFELYDHIYSYKFNGRVLKL